MKKTYLVILVIILLSLVACRDQVEKVVDIETPLIQPQQQSIEVDTNKNYDFTNDSYHPIIIAFKKYNDDKATFSNGEVLGASNENKWVTKESFSIRYKGESIRLEDLSGPTYLDENDVDVAQIKANDTYKFYSNNKFVTTQKGTNLNIGIDGYGNQIMNVRFDPFETDKDLVVGINGGWNALPRVPKQLSDENSFSVDLDGDGRDEIISLQDKNFKEYLSKGKKVLVEDNGENIIIDETPIDGIYVRDYKVLALDLNGDGKLEILTIKTGHNHTITAYEINNGKANVILDYYIGD